MNAIMILALVATQNSPQFPRPLLGAELTQCIQAHCLGAADEAQTMSLAPATEGSTSHAGCSCTAENKKLAAEHKKLQGRVAASERRITALEDQIRILSAPTETVETSSVTSDQLIELVQQLREERQRLDILLQQMEALVQSIQKLTERVEHLEAAQELDRVQQTKRADAQEQLLKDHEVRLGAAEQAIEDLKAAYVKYDTLNPMSASVGPRFGFMVLAGPNLTRLMGNKLGNRPYLLAGPTAGARLTLTLKNLLSVYGEVGAIADPANPDVLAWTTNGPLNRRPVGLNVRAGVDVFPLAFTNLPGAVKGIGLEVGGVTSWNGYSAQLKAQSAFIGAEVGPVYHWQIVPRWLAIHAGLTIMAGAQFDRDLPSPMGGAAASAGLDF